jgi:hypothetical protein
VTNFPCGVTAKPPILRLHRIKKSWIGLKYYRDLAATPPEKAKAEIAVDLSAISALASNIINHIENIEDFT